MSSPKKTGVLYLVPTPLGAGALASIPEVNRSIIVSTMHFIVESQKLGRRHILSMAPGKDLGDCQIEVYDKDSSPMDHLNLLDPVREGHDICLLSDAGSPTVADPGSPVVRLAHRQGISVKPLSGPSSIILALSASGLNGQQFTFHGYLSPRKKELQRQLRDLERSARNGPTQIFMETPYRNGAILEGVLKLKPDTLFCIAANLTTSNEYVQTRIIQGWLEKGFPDLQKVPSIFLLGY